MDFSSLIQYYRLKILFVFEKQSIKKVNRKLDLSLHRG